MAGNSKRRANGKVSPKRSNWRQGGHNVVSYLSQHALIQREIDAQLAQPLDPELLTKSALRYWIAFARVKDRLEPAEVWRPLCEAMNIGMILCEQGLGAEHLPTIIEAQDALFRTWERAVKSGQYILDAAGIGSVRRALLVHDVQIEVALRSELARAERTLDQRLAEGDTYKVEPLAA